MPARRSRKQKATKDRFRQPMTLWSSMQHWSEPSTLHTNNCWPWKEPWRHFRVHKWSSDGMANTLQADSRTKTPLKRSQVSSKVCHWWRLCAAVKAISWWARKRITFRPLLFGPVRVRRCCSEGCIPNSTDRVKDAGGMRRTCPIHRHTFLARRESQIWL